MSVSLASNSATIPTKCPGDSAVAEGKLAAPSSASSAASSSSAAAGMTSPTLRPRAASAAQLVGSDRMTELEERVSVWAERSENAGLIPRTLRGLFDALVATGQDFSVRASYIEVRA
jgi:hypothetical protein